MFFKRQLNNYFVVSVLLAVTVLVWFNVFAQEPDNILEVYFFDVGQGDSIFIETPAGRQILIDGGPDKMILKKLNQVMPFYDQTIDLIVSTHPDADHLTGLVSVLEYFEISHILTSGLEKETALYQKWRELVKKKNIPLTLTQTGQRIIIEDQVILEILWPDQSQINSFLKPTNNASVVGRLIYGQAEFLLPGDIEKKIENQLVSRGLDLEADVLKVPHHGSKTSASDNFVRKVNPQISVISVGQNNRYGHPHQEVLGRLKRTLLLRTDYNGDIEIKTDGMVLRVETEK
jgi:competence protein ComEC